MQPEPNETSSESFQNRLSFDESYHEYGSEDDAQPSTPSPSNFGENGGYGGSSSEWSISPPPDFGSPASHASWLSPYEHLGAGEGPSNGSIEDIPTSGGHEDIAANVAPLTTVKSTASSPFLEFPEGKMSSCLKGSILQCLLLRGHRNPIPCFVSSARSRSSCYKTRIASVQRIGQLTTCVDERLFALFPWS